MPVNHFYYFIKPFLFRSIQLNFRRRIVKEKLLEYVDIWPLDESSRKSLDSIYTWSNNKKFAIILTHDVDKKRGHEKCRTLINIEENIGFRSLFNFILKKYKVDAKLQKQIVSAGFEIGVHGLYHDEKLYKSRKVFHKRAS